MTHDLHFRGQLLNFLARKLPLSHPSGCNRRAQFNTQNATNVEEEAPQIQTESKENDPQILEFIEYSTFWKL